jgi:hypothetical protein
MPTKRERDYYRMGFIDGMQRGGQRFPFDKSDLDYDTDFRSRSGALDPPKKRKLSAWQKFVKANSRKKEFRYRDGKLNLKKMGVAYRRKKRR